MAESGSERFKHLSELPKPAESRLERTGQVAAAPGGPAASLGEGIIASSGSIGSTNLETCIARLDKLESRTAVLEASKEAAGLEAREGLDTAFRNTDYSFNEHMPSLTSAGTMHSLLQTQADVTENILRAQKELLKIQRQMQAMWSDVAGCEFEQQDGAEVPSEDDPKSADDIASLRNIMNAIKQEKGADALEPQDELPVRKGGTWCKVWLRTLLDPKALVLPAAGGNRLSPFAEVLPAQRLRDYLGEHANVISLYNMLLLAAMFEWFAGWVSRPETVAELCLYELIYISVTCSYCGSSLGAMIQLMVSLPHSSNLHAWFFANTWLYKLDALLRCIFAWSFILAVTLKSVINVCGDELPQFMIQKSIASSTRTMVALFNIFWQLFIVGVVIALTNVSHYTLAFSGAVCTPLASQEELAQDGGMQKLFSSTLAGLNLGTARLLARYHCKRCEEEECQIPVKQSKQHIEMSKLQFVRRRQRVESNDEFSQTPTNL